MALNSHGYSTYWKEYGVNFLSLENRKASFCWCTVIALCIKWLSNNEMEVGIDDYCPVRTG
jgi:hypothetical protein